ncbi:MAG TPA: hypothetical protein VK553_06485, partial [Candidatus Nitrosopolaris rasttigaisensis]|nr:hypothetical protein [Candidatus Nitrosopolaris rasttigaisensis]
MFPEKSGFKKQKRDATDTNKLDFEKTHPLHKPYEHSQIGPDGQPITGNVQLPDRAAELINKGKQLATDIIQGTRGTQTPDTGLGPQEDSASSSASKKERFKTANGRDYEISGPVEGPYLDAEFERRILRQEGFADDEVYMVEPPSFDYNPLGYALFKLGKRGTITSEDAKKVLDDNFVPDTCEQGRVFQYNPLTKTLVG